MKQNFTPEVKKQLDDLLKNWIQEAEEDFSKNDEELESEEIVEKPEVIKPDDS